MILALPASVKVKVGKRTGLWVVAGRARFSTYAQVFAVSPTRFQAQRDRKTLVATGVWPRWEENRLKIHRVGV